jgi:hypothetical protein
MAFLGLFYTAESEKGVAAGLGGRHTRAEIVRHVKIEMRGEFIVEFAVEPLFVKQVAKADPGCA